MDWDHRMIIHYFLQRKQIVVFLTEGHRGQENALFFYISSAEVVMWCYK